MPLEKRTGSICSISLGHLHREATKLLRYYDDNGDQKKKKKNTPLIFHVFSNGGGIPLYRFQQIMAEKTGRHSTDANGGDKYYENVVIDDDEDIDWNLLQDRLKVGAEIFDSAPAFPDMETFQGAVNAALPNPVLRTVMFYIIATLYTAMNFFLKVQGKRNWSESYWRHWENCELLSATQAYVFSTADTITKSHKLDELAKIRSAKGAHVLTKKFDDSFHVQHMIRHKEEYCGVINDVLKRSTAMP